MSIDSLRDGFVTLCINTSLNVYAGACQMLVEGQYLADFAEATFTQISTNNLLATDTFEVGNSTFTIVTSIGSTPGNVLKGSNWLGTMNNIINALAASVNSTGATANYVPLATPANVEGTVSGTVALFTALEPSVLGSTLPSVYTDVGGTAAGAFGGATFAEVALPMGAAANVPILVNSVNDCESLFGAGSILCESLKKVFTTCSQNIQVWALPRPDAGGAVSAVYTFTVSGTATGPGVFSLFWLDEEYNVDFAVAAGQTASQVAAALVAAIPYNFPYSASVSGAVITLTALNGGTCGNYLAPVYNFLGLQNYAPPGISVSCVQTTPGSGDPAPLNYANTLGSCCYSVYALLGTDAAWQLAMENWIRAAWACNIPAGFNGAVPQCFGHGYTFNAGTLGQVLSRGDNAEVFNRVAYPLNNPLSPHFLVASYAALSACSACYSPELAIQGPVDGVLTALAMPTSCQEPWSYAARITLFNAGFVTWGPMTNQASQLTNPFIYSDITNNLTDQLDRPNPTWQSTTTRRWTANFSKTLSQFLDGTFNGLSAFANGTTIKPGIFGTTLNMMRAKLIAWLNSQAGIAISTIVNVDTQVIMTSSMDTSPPCQGVPGNYALALTVQPPVRINNIATTLFPQLLTNCTNNQFNQAFQLANQ